jgi:hypothetical protein
MKKPSSSMLDLVRQLSQASRSASDPRATGPVAVLERLRASLSSLAGIEGFCSLLRRALILAVADHAALREATVDAEGHLRGIANADTTGPGGADEEAILAVVAHLLDLLVTFVGRSLTLRLLQEAWPDLDLNAAPAGVEEDR